MLEISEGDAGSLRHPRSGRGVQREQLQQVVKSSAGAPFATRGPDDTGLPPFLAYEFSDMFGNVRQINVGKIGESDEREFLFDVT